jgi:hypothetical protein
VWYSLWPLMLAGIPTLCTGTCYLLCSFHFLFCI